MKTLSTLFLGAFLIVSGVVSAEGTKMNCNCKDCQCTADSHCGCFDKGCPCGQGGGNRGCGCGKKGDCKK